LWAPAPVEDFDKKQHRQFVDSFKERHRGESWVAVSAAVSDEKVSLIVEVSEDLAKAERVRADLLVRELAAIIDGRGGGKPSRAEAGGRHPERLRELYERAREAVRLMVEGQRV
jgi:alanyl-tRNA synthetase